MTHVYIPNRSFHDFAGASMYGELVYLTTGRVNQFRVNPLARDMAEAMRDSAAYDYLLVSSLPILNALAASLLARKHGRVNYLIYNGSSYEQRTTDFANFETEKE